MAMINGIDDADIQAFEIEDSVVSDEQAIGSFNLNTANVKLVNLNKKYDNLKGTWLDTVLGKLYVNDAKTAQGTITSELSCYDLAYKFDKEYDPEHTMAETRKVSALLGKIEQTTYSGKNQAVMGGEIKDLELKGLTVNLKDGVLSVKGTVVNGAYPSVIFYADGTYSTYQWWADVGKINHSKGDMSPAGKARVISTFVEGTGEYTITGMLDTTVSSYFYRKTGSQSTAIGQATIFNGFSIGFYPNTEVDLSIKVQIEDGSTPTAYEPYVGHIASPNPDYPQEIKTITGNQTVKVGGFDYPLSLGDIELAKIGDYTDKIKKNTGKNLLPYPYAGNFNSNGITFTDNGDGTITLNGKNNGNGNSAFFLLNNSSFSLTAGVYAVSGVVGSMQFVFYNGSTWYERTEASPIQTLIANETFPQIYIQIRKGDTTTFNNLTIRPMIEKGSVVTPYEPYGKGWYIEKNIGKVELSTLTWTQNRGGSGYYYHISKSIRDIKYVPNNQTLGDGVAEKYIMRIGSGLSGEQYGKIAIDVAQIGVNTGKVQGITPSGLFYYAKSAPTYTTITDETLLEQLDTLPNMKGEEVESNIEFETEDKIETFAFPSKVGKWLESICYTCGVECATPTFPNSDIMLQRQPYLPDGASYRDAVREIAGSAGSFAQIIDNKLHIKWFDNTTTTAQDWFTLEQAEEVPAVNEVVLGRGDLEDNIIYPSEPPENPYELRIDDNQILLGNEQEAIVPIYNRVKDFKYRIFKLSFTGLKGVKAGQKITYIDINGDTITTPVMSNRIKFLGGDYNDPNSYECELESVQLKETNTTYKYAGTITKSIKKTEAHVNKIDGDIQLITEDVQTVKDDLTNNYTTIEQSNVLVQTAVGGLMNTFSNSGGNNLIRNSSLYFGSEDNFDYWDGVLKQAETELASSKKALLLKKGRVEQSISGLVPSYVSLKLHYKKVGQAVDTTAKLIFNGVEYPFENEGTLEITQNISSGATSIAFEAKDNEQFIVYDLMLNYGQAVYLPYQQAQNELKSTQVSISQEIKVESNVENTVTTIGANGLVGRNKTSQEIVFKQTDSGSYSKTIETESAKISDLIISKIGDQVWITGT